MLDQDFFETADYIEFDEESGIWQQIDPLNYIEQVYQEEQQIAKQENIPPRIQKVHKTASIPNQKEQWSHQRVAPNVVCLSNTKYLRQCVSKELLPPNSYVILPVQEYQAFRCGSKDFKFGAPCVILIDPAHCLGSVMDFGKELDQHFGFTSPEDTVNP
ncbi:MAG: hypothetical protein [Chaetfec virus UA24_3359]|nr:MAG: hypothetical protein [Chaetfec virus UA24_3359]